MAKKPAQPLSEKPEVKNTVTVLAPQSKYSTEIVDKICTYIGEGHTKALACELAGITYATLNNWENGNGITEEDKFYIFDALKKADERREQELLQRIYDAGKLPKHWQANAWLLQKLYGDKYVDKKKVDANVTSYNNTRILAVTDSKVARTVLNSLQSLVESLNDEKIQSYLLSEEADMGE